MDNYDKDEDKQTSFNDENRFYILGNFDEQCFKHIVIPFTKKIEDLSKEKEASVEFYINSRGGDGWLLFHLVALFERAKAKGIVVKTFVPTIAFSAGSMLAIAGTKGERYISPMAEHLPHYGTVYGWPKKTPLQLERESAYYKRWFKKGIDHYKKYSNIPKIEEELKDDSFFIPASKCIRWGLADKYMDGYNA